MASPSLFEALNENKNKVESKIEATTENKTVVDELIGKKKRKRRVFGERKNKRINLVAKPSVYDKFQKICAAQGVSANGKMNALIEKYVEENLEFLEKFRELYGDEYDED